MIEITEADLKEKENEYIKLAEEGEVILVERPDGTKTLMVPQDPSKTEYWDDNPCDI
jgi:hypothetical protein|tara:strand:+ start:1090 stop:1260 length:171 start_codon:yes stop_codon:yes gene_type:complete